MDDKRILNRSIRTGTTILNALKQMDEMEVKSLLVLDDNSKLDGIISIGDIQRAIINNRSLEGSVKDILRPDPELRNWNFIK